MKIIAFCSKDIKSLRKRRRGVNYIFPGKTRDAAEELKRKCCPREAAAERGQLQGSALVPLGSPLSSGWGELVGEQPDVLGTGWHGPKK